MLADFRMKAAQDHLICYKTSPLNVSNVPNCHKFYQIDIQHCLELLRAPKQIIAFLFLFRKGNCVPTNIKSIGELVKYGVQKWEARSLI